MRACDPRGKRGAALYSVRARDAAASVFRLTSDGERKTSERKDGKGRANIKATGCVCVCVESNANGYVPTPLFFFLVTKLLPLALIFAVPVPSMRTKSDIGLK